MPFTPTPEQECALDLFSSGANVAITAGAGTGKTTTLEALARSTKRSGRYLAFNRAIVNDAGKRMPHTCSAQTIHQAAMGAVGHQFRHRLDAPRQSSETIARRLGLGPLNLRVDTAGGTINKVLTAGTLASIAMEAVNEFCKSADPEPTVWHVGFIDGIDMPTEDGRRTYANNNIVRAHIADAITAIWQDACDPNGTLRYNHDRYLKLWELSNPVVGADYLMCDEAQDVSKVMLSIFLQQQHAQMVFVGDPQQCQPTGTMVTVVDSYRRGNGHSGSQPLNWRQVPIEEVMPGDLVPSFGMAKSFLRRSGSEVLKTAHRTYRGDLIDVEVAGHRSSYTPNHRCVVRLDAAFDDKYVVYLMRRGGDYRIGKTTGSYASQDRQFGLPMRMLAEGADAGWVLSVHDSEAEALEAEQMAAWTHGVPTLTFAAGRGRSQPMLDRLWSKLGSNEADARACLLAHSRLIDHPLVVKGASLWRRRSRTIAACNLVDGMQMLPVTGALDAEGKQITAKRWAPITVSRSWYEGDVYSLEVAKDETYVADGIVTHNSIYGWLGNVDAMDELPGAFNTQLSKSFRFGPEIARVANGILDVLGADLRLTGHDPIRSQLRKLERPDAILCRSNAHAIENVMTHLDKGLAVHLVGEGKEIIRFAKGAIRLQAGQTTDHPELACFGTWGEVQDYVSLDAQGGELKLLVELIDKFGAQVIIDALEHMPKEEDADLIVSTAHKSKGREWDHVQLGDDFPEPDEDGWQAEELRLLYVAATRGRLALDVGNVPYFHTPSHQRRAKP